MKKNDIVRGECIDYSKQGYGVVKIAGFLLFVKGLLLGEEAEIRILSLKKNYGYGKIEKLLKISRNRVKEECTVATVCGGCQFQHLNYSGQLAFKQKQIAVIFERNNIETAIMPIIPADSPWRYRNKVQVPFRINGKGKLSSGFYRSHSNEIVEFTDCLVQSELSNRLIMEIRDILSEDKENHNLRHVLLKHMDNTAEVMLVFIVRSHFSALDKAVEVLTEKYPEIKSIIMNINTRNDNVILGEEEYLLYGSEYVTDNLGNKRFMISPKSFYQINSKQTEKLYQKVLEYAAITKDDTVLDLYGGIGTIGILASDYAKRVISVEIVAEAVADGTINAQINNVSNIEFFCGDVQEFVQASDEKVDIVIVDPPRKGISAETITAIKKLAPSKLIYVSCDPQTLLRDLKSFTEDYNVTVVQPVDMFPQTVHIECVCLLERIAI